MPLHDFHCVTCGKVEQDVYRSITDGANGSPPICPTCGAIMQWIVPVVAIDAKSEFAKFTVHRDIYEKNPATGDVERFQRAEVIDSTHTMRRIEADSERRYRNGEGEPMRFRALSQNRSNLDQGLFGTDGQIGEQRYDSGSAPVKSGKVSTTRHGAKKPKVKVARHAGQSPLKG